MEVIGHRHQRLEHILAEELQLLLRDEVADPALSDIHITSVTLSPDGGHARIAYAVLVAGDGDSGEDEVESAPKLAFERAGGFLRAQLALRLNLKRTPKLSFVCLGRCSELATEAPSSEPQGDIENEGGER
jgi:ribosome-binding factor A